MRTGEEIHGFLVGEKIGSGGMATVFRAVQTSLDRPVCLKVLHPHLAEDPGLVARFEREARAAAHLRHENIVQVIDFGREGETSFIAMELVEGMDLRRLMDTLRPLPVPISVLLLRGVARGLEHAHLHGVVHRDIKPANLMLTPEGRVKIMDFGLARSGEETAHVTVTGSVLGTPAYMSPEQADGKPVDIRSDLFSLGIVAYELLSGRRPFGGDSFTGVLRAILAFEPEPLDERAGPADLRTLVHRLLEKDPALRGTCTEARQVLDGVAGSMGLREETDWLRDFLRDPEGCRARLATDAPPATIGLDTVVQAPAAQPPVLQPSAVKPPVMQAPVVPPTSPAASAPPPAGPSPAPGSAPIPARAPLPDSRLSSGTPSRFRRRIPILAGSLAVVVVAIVAVLLLRGSRPPLPPPPEPTGAASPPNAGDKAAAVSPGSQEVAIPSGWESTHQSTSSGGTTEPADGGSTRTPPQGGGAQPQAAATTPANPAAPGAATANAPRESAPVRRTYRVSAKPFAYIYVDGQTRPVNPDGFPADIVLSGGSHELRAENRNLGKNVVFRYQVTARDTSRTLILDLEDGTIEARR